MVLINDNSKTLKIGDPLPHFSLPATDGLIVNSRDMKDPVLVVIFTCNHCPYAQAYEDRIIAVAKEFQSKGVAFVLVNSNDATNYPEDSFESMKKRHREKNYPFPYCFDESQEVARSFGALCTPHCFVLDQNRKLQYKGRVDDNWKDPASVKERNLHDAIAALVSAKKPPKHEANAIGCSIKWRE